tara:strand:- start:192 stop:614 length:423 start_codon:yes stop_codon:yes gene_type:complete
MNTLTRINVPNILVDGYMWSDMLTNLSRDKFPHTDMVKLGEDKFEIHLSLAGYKKEDIDVTLDNNILSISGTWKNVDEEGYAVKGVNYLMHGIAKRKFQRMFPLAEFVEVKSVVMDNGILKISVDKVLPEELKPKVFEIT